MFRQSPCIVENVRCEYGKVLIDLSEAPIPNSNSGGGGDPGLLLPPSKSNVPSPSRRATTVAFKELLCSVTDVERRDLLRGFGADAEDWSIAVADKNLYVLMTCPGHRGHSNDSEQDAYTSGLPPKLDPLVSSRSMNAAIADKFFRERQLLLQVLNSDKEEWNADDWLLVIKALIDELSMAKPTAELLETLSREADDGISRLLKGSSRTDAGRALTGGERDLLLGPRIAHNRPIFVREREDWTSIAPDVRAALVVAAPSQLPAANISGDTVLFSHDTALVGRSEYRSAFQVGVDSAKEPNLDKVPLPILLSPTLQQHEMTHKPVTLPPQPRATAGAFHIAPAPQWCKPGLKVKSIKTKRRGEVERLNGPWVSVFFAGDQKSTPTRVSELLPIDPDNTPGKMLGDDNFHCKLLGLACSTLDQYA